MIPRATRTLRWRLHLILALVSFTTIGLAVSLLTAPILAWGLWHGMAVLLVIAGIWTPAAVILFFTAGGVAAWRPYFGLFQRAIYLGMICWLAVVLVPQAFSRAAL